MKRRTIFLNKGFTLIELLVVIAIIMILMAIGVTSYQNAQKVGRDGKRKADLKQVQSALEMYRADRNIYPASNAGKIVGCGVDGTTACSWGSSWTVGSDAYLGKLPTDPSGGPDYYYTQTGASYTLKACIENVNDSEKMTDSYCSTVANIKYEVSNP